MSLPVPSRPGAASTSFGSVMERLREKHNSLLPARIPAREPDPAGTALSFAQQRLWFLSQLQPGNPVYNIAAAIRIHGALDAAALRFAFAVIVARHETLRTVLRMAEGRPVQIVAAEGNVDLPVVDLAALPAGEETWRSLAVAESLRPFDLARGPLLRTQLLRLGSDRHVLLLTMHHVIGDGWSIGILVRESRSGPIKRDGALTC